MDSELGTRTDDAPHRGRLGPSGATPTVATLAPARGAVWSPPRTPGRRGIFCLHLTISICYDLIAIDATVIGEPTATTINRVGTLEAKLLKCVSGNRINIIEQRPVVNIGAVMAAFAKKTYW